MSKMLIILIVYYILIIISAAYSKSINISEKEFIGDDKENRQRFQIWCNNTGKESENPTFVIDKSPSGIENKTTEFLHAPDNPPSSRTYKKEFISTLQPNLENSEISSTADNVKNINKTQVNSQNDLELTQVINQIFGRTNEDELTPTLFPNPENSVNDSTSNTDDVPEITFDDRISKNAIITLMGGSDPGIGLLEFKKRLQTKAIA